MRRGKPGEYLATDEYYGTTVYASRLSRDHDGYYAVKPLKRNLQEIASPLNDPTPVPPRPGPNYEQMPAYNLTTVGPQNVGLTSQRTKNTSAAIQSLNISLTA